MRKFFDNGFVVLALITFLFSASCKIGRGKEASTTPEVAAPAPELTPTPTPTPSPTPTPNISVAGISPSSGTNAGGTAVTINGSGFTSGAISVTLDGVTCASPVVVSDSSLDCTTGASNFTRSGDVKVTRQEDGLQAAAAGAWTYLQALTSFTWTGTGGNHLWNNPANWAGGTVPTSTSNVIFSGTWCSGSDCNATLNTSIHVNSLKMSANFPGTITEDASFMNNSEVTIGNNAADDAFIIEGGTWAGYSGGGGLVRRVNGVARFSGGTMNFNRNFSYYSSLFVLGGTFSTSGTLLRGTGVVQLKANVPLPHLQILNGSGGYVEVDGTVQTTDFLINSQGTCTGASNKILGGTIEVSGDLTVQHSCGGTTSFVMKGMNKSIAYGGLPAAPGGIFPGSLTFTTNTGTHDVNFDAGGYTARFSGDIALNSGTTLSLGGSDLSIGGNLDVQSGATVNLGGGILTVGGTTSNNGTINP